MAVELELPQADGSIVYRQIKPQPQDEITLLFEHLKKDGTIGWATGRRMPWGNGPELLLGLQPPGTYVFGVTAEAIGGSGRIVPNGILMQYERHPEKPALMISTMTAPQRNASFAARELVYLDRRLTPHLRSFKIDTQGLPDDPLGVDFSVNLVALYMKDGRPIMLTRNTVSGLNYAFAKVQSGTGGAAAPVPAISQPGAAPSPKSTAT